MIRLATIHGTEESTDVATTQPVVKLTYEDYRTTFEDERYELLDEDLKGMTRVVIPFTTFGYISLSAFRPPFVEGRTVVPASLHSAASRHWPARP